MLDVKIAGGSVVDGTGTARRQADVGIRDGRIVAIGQIDEPATRTIDASGLIVAPGFVDIHTHYDAQAFWDPALTPSPLHGVTTVVGGNCGFTIAPLAASEADYLMRMLSRVEGMPLESLAAGVPWDWQTFGEYLDRLDGTLAVNAGFLVGHSALRRVAMGDRSHEPATDDDVATMCRTLGESLTAGGLGFSTTRSPTHSDTENRPVASRVGPDSEVIELCRAVSEYPGTTLEAIVDGQVSDRKLQAELMGGFSLASMFLAALGVFGLLSFAVESRREGQSVGRAWGRPLEEAAPPQEPARRPQHAPRAKAVGFRERQRRKKALRASNRQAAKK